MKTIMACTALLAFGALTAVTLAQPPEGGPKGPPPGRQGGPAHGRPQGPPDGPPPPPPLMKALDADGDGTLSAEEIAGASEALKSLDKNDDGKLSGDEIRPPHPPRGPKGRGPDARRGGPGRHDEFGPPPGGPRARRGGPDEFQRGPSARGPRRGGDGPAGLGAGGPPPFLPPHLRDELGLSEDQLQAMAEVHKEAREKFEKLLTDEQREKMKELGPPRGPRED